MTPQLTFLGAAGTVTGSKFLLESDGARVLLECGLFQGLRSLQERNWTPPVQAPALQAVVLSHAHIDHSGNIPNLVKSGFKGDLYATFATRDLCAVMLLDSAHIQEADTEFVNKKRAQKGEPTSSPKPIRTG